MARIAHLTDLHLLEPRPHRRGSRERLRLRFLSFGRPLDAGDRRARFRRALQAVAASGADHLLLTGDLTEDGMAAQFEALAEELLDGPVPPERITLLPGNHDAYADDGAWERALAGPLRPFARTSAPRAVVPLDDGTVVVPVSTRMHQPFTRAAGRVPAGDVAKVEGVLASRDHRHGTVIVGIHHPPVPHPLPGGRWLDGIENLEAARRPLLSDPRVHVLHGHTHRRTDQPLTRGGRRRVFSTTACVESPRPLRLYEAREGTLAPLPLVPMAPPIDQAGRTGGRPGKIPEAPPAASWG